MARIPLATRGLMKTVYIIEISNNFHDEIIIHKRIFLSRKSAEIEIQKIRSKDNFYSIEECTLMEPDESLQH